MKKIRSPVAFAALTAAAPALAPISRAPLLQQGTRYAPTLYN
jgi:hypothetical protein